MHYGILGIDWGASKVGVAVANTETRLAMGVTTFRNDEYLLENLEKTIKEYEIQLVVIGNPVRNAYLTDASSEPSQEKPLSGGEILGATLEKKFGLRVVYHNEMYTTKMARANLVEKGAHHLDQQDDREAARLILQSWLDAQK
ncbi:MAG: Holliday junction resolvase RuvX [Candidatus Moraniibacteriota bacterium]